MARRTVEELANADLRLVYIAGNLPDAEAAERCLTEQGIEYALSLEPFTLDDPVRRGWQYMGLYVYVPLLEHRKSRLALEASGLSPTIELEEEGAEDCHAS